MAGESWVPERLVLYVSGRAEATFSDGSAVILHPPNAAKASFFSSDGRRQRLLSTCSPQFGRAEVRAKIMAAAAVRDQFHPHPSSLAVESHRKCFGKLLERSSAVWPSHAPQARQDGSVEVSSLDGSVHLTLAPHGSTFVVQWLRPIAGSYSSPESPETCSDDPCLFRSEDRAASSLLDCVQQVQCFAVQEPVEVAWVYPLLICLLRHQTCDERGDVIRGLAETLRQCQINGTVLDSGHCVTVPLPAAQIGDGAHGGSHSGDDISPAACMGTFGEGRVMLSWTPQSAIRLGQREASVELLDLGSTDSSYQWAFLESSLSGHFWKMRASSNLEWQLPDVFCLDLLPPRDPGDSPFACRLIALVEEASLWLRQNSSESVAGTGDPGCTSPGNSNPWPHGPKEALALAWLQEAELEDGGACLTVFRWGERRLVRLLFAEGARMDFEAPPSAHLELLGPGSNFRLLTERGELLERRFAEPLGAEAEVAQALRLLRKLSESKRRHGDGCGRAAVAAVAAVAAEAALRRTQVFLGPGLRGPKVVR